MNVDMQKVIREMPGNKNCADCGALTPQWASVSHGSLVCLNCSGQHRSLGVHLSFVRSVTMDSWSDKQVRARVPASASARITNHHRHHHHHRTITASFFCLPLARLPSVRLPFCHFVLAFKHATVLSVFS